MSRFVGWRLEPYQWAGLSAGLAVTIFAVVAVTIEGGFRMMPAVTVTIVSLAFTILVVAALTWLLPRIFPPRRQR